MLDRTTPPPVRPIGDLSLPKPQTIALPNGARLSLLNGGQWDVCNLSLLFSGGCIEARSEAIATLCASLLPEGTALHSGEYINDYLDFHGAFFGAAASDHFTTTHLTWLTSISGDMLPLLAEVLTQPTFPEEALAAYKQQSLAMLRTKQAKVDYQSQRALAKLIMGADNPNAAMQTPEDIERVTAADLRDWHRRAFTASGCHAFLSGKFGNDTVEEVKAFLMSLPASPGVGIKRFPLVAQQPQTVTVEMPAAKQASVSMALPAPPRTSPDYIPLRFAVMALGGYFGSRLMRNIREDKGYTYGIRSSLMGTLDGSYIYISADTDVKYVEPLIIETKKEIEEMSTRLLSAEEMQSLKQHISSDLIETLNTPFTIMDHYGSIITTGMPEGYFNAQVKAIHNLTAEDIRSISACYLLPYNLRLAIAK